MTVFNYDEQVSRMGRSEKRNGTVINPEFSETAKRQGTMINEDETKAKGKDPLILPNRLPAPFDKFRLSYKKDSFPSSSEWYCFTAVKTDADPNLFLLKISARDRLALESVANRVSFLTAYGYITDMSGKRHFACVEPVCSHFNLRAAMEQDPKGTVHMLAQMLNRYHSTDKVIHCDIKPEHIVREGSELALCDWSCAQAARSAEDMTGTIFQDGDNSGYTPRYAPIERIDYGQCSRLTDLYSIGICLIEAMTGRNPYDGLPFEEMRQMKTHPLDVSMISDRNLANLIAGLTTDRNYRHKYGIDMMLRYADGQPVPDPYNGQESSQKAREEHSEGPGSKENDKKQKTDSSKDGFPYRFAGRSCQSFDELARMMLAFPDEALKHIKTGVLPGWLQLVGRQDAAIRCSGDNPDYAAVSAAAYTLSEEFIPEIHFGKNIYSDTTALGEYLRNTGKWDLLAALSKREFFTAYFSRRWSQLSDKFKKALAEGESMTASPDCSLTNRILMTYLITPAGKRSFQLQGSKFRNIDEFTSWFRDHGTEKMAEELNSGNRAAEFKCWLRAVGKEH